MDIRIEAQSPISTQVEVTLDEKEVAAGVNKRLKEIGKTAKVQGFRKGKVPPKLLRQKYGRAARMDAIDRLVNDAMPKALEHDDLQGTIHVTQPELKDGVMSGPLVFSFAAEKLPEIELGKVEGLEVDKVKVQVEEAAVEARLKAIQDEHTDIVPVEDRDEIAADDIVIATYHGRGSDDAEQIHAHDQQIDLSDENLLDGFASGLAGAKKGEQTTIQLQIPAEFGLESLRGQAIDVEVTVSEIKRKEVPALDDELAKLTGDAETLADLQKAYRDELVAAAEEREEQAAKRRLMDQLVEAHTTELPPEYVRTQAEQEAVGRLRELMGQGLDIQNMGIDPRQMAAGLEDDVKRSMIESLVLRQIVEAQGIEISDDDIDAFLADQAEKSGQPLPRLKAQFGDPEQRMRLSIRLQFDRALDFVWSKATITEVDAIEEEDGADDETGDGSTDD